MTETEECLDSFIQKVHDYSTVFDSMKNDLNNLKPQNLTSLENEFSKTDNFENDAQLKSKTILSEINEINSQIPQLISKIEDKLQLFSNTTYSISQS